MLHLDFENASVLVGLSWQDKITTLRAKMTERKITWFVATALDEIACMINISFTSAISRCICVSD